MGNTASRHGGSADPSGSAISTTTANSPISPSSPTVGGSSGILDRRRQSHSAGVGAGADGSGSHGHPGAAAGGAVTASGPAANPDPGNRQAAAALYHQEARIDNGHLVPLSNIYPNAPQDWLHDVVQTLIVQRKIAPFYRGLDDCDGADDNDDENDESSSFDVEAINTALNNVGDEQAKKWRRKLYKDADRKAEANMYRKAAECPICFLYYPPLINTSRCCDQPICTECFVQIKRTDPTPTNITSEPAACPYCVEPNFGVTYIPPPVSHRTGLGALKKGGSGKHAVSSNMERTLSGQSAASSSSNGAEAEEAGPATAAHKRRKSVSHTAAEVVTTDSIQEDWEAKLAAMRAVVARRSARRVVFRQIGERLVPVGITSGGREVPNSITDEQGRIILTGPTPIVGQGFGPPPSNQTMPVGPAGIAIAGSAGVGSSSAAAESTGTHSPSRLLGRQSRRHRGSTSASASDVDPRVLNMGADLEELMVMEAMRLSLLDEEERRKKADKDAKAQTKKEPKKRGGLLHAIGNAKHGHDAASSVEAGPSGTSDSLSSGAGVPSTSRRSLDVLRSSLDRGHRSSVDKQHQQDRDRSVSVSEAESAGASTSTGRSTPPRPRDTIAEPETYAATSSSSQVPSPSQSRSKRSNQNNSSVHFSTNQSPFLRMPPMARNDSTASMSQVNMFLPPPMVPSKASAAPPAMHDGNGGVRQLTQEEMSDLL